MWRPVPSFAIVCTCVYAHMRAWAQSRLTLDKPKYCSLPGSSVHGISQARVSCSFPPPGNLSYPGVKPASPTLAGRFFTTVLPGKPLALYPPSHFSLVRDTWLVVDFCRVSDEEEEQSIENHRWLSFLIVYPVYLYIYKNQLMSHEGPWCH